MRPTGCYKGASPLSQQSPSRAACSVHERADECQQWKGQDAVERLAEISCVDVRSWEAWEVPRVQISLERVMLMIK